MPVNRRLTQRELAVVRHLVALKRLEAVQQADRARWSKSPDARKHYRART